MDRAMDQIRLLWNEVLKPSLGELQELRGLSGPLLALSALVPEAWRLAKTVTSDPQKIKESAEGAKREFSALVLEIWRQDEAISRAAERVWVALEKLAADPVARQASMALVQRAQRACDRLLEKGVDMALSDTNTLEPTLKALDRVLRALLEALLDAGERARTSQDHQEDQTSEE